MLVAFDSIATARTFQLAIEAVPTGVLVVDARGTIVLVNGEIERQFGYGREELLGQVVDLLLPAAQQSIECPAWTGPAGPAHGRLRDSGGASVMPGTSPDDRPARHA